MRWELWAILAPWRRNPRSFSFSVLFSLPSFPEADFTTCSKRRNIQGGEAAVAANTRVEPLLLTGEVCIVSPPQRGRSPSVSPFPSPCPRPVLLGASQMCSPRLWTLAQIWQLKSPSSPTPPFSSTLSPGPSISDHSGEGRTGLSSRAVNVWFGTGLMGQQPLLELARVLRWDLAPHIYPNTVLFTLTLACDLSGLNIIWGSQEMESLSTARFLDSWVFWPWYERDNIVYGKGARTSRFKIWTQSLSGYLASRSNSVPLFPHLSNGDNKSLYLTGVLWQLNGLTGAKYLELWLHHSRNCNKCLIIWIKIEILF